MNVQKILSFIFKYRMYQNLVAQFAYVAHDSCGHFLNTFKTKHLYKKLMSLPLHLQNDRQQY